MKSDGGSGPRWLLNKLSSSEEEKERRRGKSGEKEGRQNGEECTACHCGLEGDQTPPRTGEKLFTTSTNNLQLGRKRGRAPRLE